MNGLGTISIQGIIVLDLFALGLIFLILNLVRTRKLYVSYAVIWVLAITAGMIIISIPSFLIFVTKAVGAIFPASAMTMLALGYIFLVLTFFSVRLSIISSRQVALAQAIALSELLTQEETRKHLSIVKHNQTDFEGHNYDA